jgi:hypothetical protein
VGSENIAPKSVAREMLERFCSFHDYIRDHGLQRVEGVLLRYVTEVYKGLGQSVPARHRTPELMCSSNWAGLQRFLVAWSMMSSRWARAWRRPSARS